MANLDFIFKNRNQSTSDIGKGYNNPFSGFNQLKSQFGGATKENQVNAQNISSIVNSPSVQDAPRTRFQAPVESAPQPQSKQRFGSPTVGYHDTYEAALAALERNTTPPSVDLNIPDKIASPALDYSGTGTGLREGSKDKREKVLDSRFSKEEKELLEQITSFRVGLSDLEATQAREFYEAEQNPEGVFGPGVLEGQLGRLSREQAIELNARTGQLNAALDNLELYQGYRPQIVGTPQIDAATGNAFAYIQDPMTGEISVQDMGQVTTPEIEEQKGFTLGKDQVRYEYDESGIPQPVGYGVSGGTTTGGGLYTGSDDDIMSVAVSVANDLPSQSERDGALSALALYKNAATLDQLIETAGSGPVTGLRRKATRWAGGTTESEDELKSLSTIFTANFIKAISGVQVSDRERKFLEGALPSESKTEQNNRAGIASILEFISNKYSPRLGVDLSQLATQKIGAEDGINTGRIEEGTQFQLDDGRVTEYRKGKFIDPYSGKEMTDVEM